MKSQFESAKHRKIHAVKDDLAQEATNFLNRRSALSDRIMGLIPAGNFRTESAVTTSDLCVRLVSQTHTVWERKKIRKIANV